MQKTQSAWFFIARHARGRPGNIFGEYVVAKRCLFSTDPLRESTCLLAVEPRKGAVADRAPRQGLLKIPGQVSWQASNKKRVDSPGGLSSAICPLAL